MKIDQAGEGEATVGAGLDLAVAAGHAHAVVAEAEVGAGLVEAAGAEAGQGHGQKTDPGQGHDQRRGRGQGQNPGQSHQKKMTTMRKTDFRLKKFSMVLTFKLCTHFQILHLCLRKILNTVDNCVLTDFTYYIQNCGFCIYLDVISITFMKTLVQHFTITI